MSANVKTSADSVLSPASQLAFRAPRKDLHKALKRLQSVSDAKSTLPILANIAIRATMTGVTFSATDLNVSMTISAPVAWNVSSVGSVCVNAKSLATIVGKLPGDEVSLQVMNRAGIQVAVVTSGSVSMTLDGRSDRDFPKIPSATEGLTFSAVPAATLSDMFEKALFSICKDETRFHLNGILVESDGSTMRTVSTDGHRLTKIERSIVGPRIDGVIVAMKGCQTLVKTLGSKAKGTCDIAIKGPNMFVRYEGTELALKLIDAQFPPYMQVIPQGHPHFATVNRKAFLGALERAAVLCSQTRGVKITIGDGGIRLKSDAPSEGESVESIPADGCGAEREKTVSFGMNATYLIEAIEGMPDVDVTLAYSDKELDPVIVTGCQDACDHAGSGKGGFLVVTMPMRI